MSDRWIAWIVNRIRKSIICVRILKVFTFKKAFKNIKNSDFGLISNFRHHSKSKPLSLVFEWCLHYSNDFIPFKIQTRKCLEFRCLLNFGVEYSDSQWIGKWHRHIKKLIHTNYMYCILVTLKKTLWICKVYLVWNKQAKNYSFT